MGLSDSLPLARWLWRWPARRGGTNIGGIRDAFHSLWTRRSGNLHLAADIALDPAAPGSDPYRSRRIAFASDRLVR